MSKHTPGNWFVLDLREHEEQIERLTVSNGEHVVCRIENTVRGGPIDEQDVANARLISAAPELLEILQDLLVVLGSRGRKDFASRIEFHERVARAAIAKATA